MFFVCVCSALLNEAQGLHAKKRCRNKVSGLQSCEIAIKQHLPDNTQRGNTEQPCMTAALENLVGGSVEQEAFLILMKNVL